MSHRFSPVIFCVSIALFAPAILFGEDAPSAASADPVVLRSDFTDSDALSADAADGSSALAAQLKRLDPNGPIWITPDRGEVLLLGTICLRQGLLEFFACGKNSKEHESIVSLEVKPYLLHAALLVIGARPGAPARFSPEFVPPSGEEIEILVRWRDGDEIQQRRAQELVRQVGGGQEMVSPWVFTGGTMAKDAKGRAFYTADVTGEVIGVSNFPASVLDVPFQSSSDNDALEFEPFTERIPEVGTPVTLVLRRAANQAVDADAGESVSGEE
ncbi:MAG: hypothetical protein J6S75_03125 [Thermoguttaceae bacterium]|nr:hypothetical protein [Thermoguttaceae bacterium]